MADTLTHGRVLKIAIPMVISSASVPILGLVDTGVVGQMGAAAPIGGVGIGALILASFYWIFGFLRMGMTGLVAQAVGRGDRAEEVALLVRGLMMGLAAGGVLIVLQIPLFAAGFWVSPASDEVEGLAQSYMGIRIWSAPAAIGLYAINGWLIAKERTMVVLLLQLWINGLNIILDLWFVLGLGWGVEGVAWATLIAELSGGCLGLWLCRDALGRRDQWDWARIWDRAALRNMGAVNGDILIRTLLLQAVFVSFLLYGAHFGDATLAANHVLLQFMEVTAYGLDGFAYSAETLVGQAIGARNVAALRRSVRLVAIWSIGLAAVLVGVFALAGGWGIDRMTTAEDVRAAARSYWPWMVIAPILGVTSWLLDGVFIGATQTRIMRNMMIVSSAIYAIAVLIAVPMMGNHGLWFAMSVCYVARGVTLAFCYPVLERAVATGKG